ncbi:hypothetical protein AZI87_08470 [Bdellovibrio bacteriovorus]|uniref:Uncharacterized protein n=1 Tax=Bdellovibrio bacteriovorus TaxID=959 RepID=A0A162GYG7_BDEBC|nr:hypothetical protein [Bdellovibrio bacteriovorus]KYG69231.1 hypothetical protein AZI87_08470 [Bdellovibrio bacteriovorus]
MRSVLLFSLIGLFSSGTFATAGNPAITKYEIQSESSVQEIDEKELEALIEALNEFIKADQKYRSDMEPIFRNIRRELAKLKEKGLLKMEFDPRRISNDDLAEKIRKMTAYKKVAGPSMLVKTIHIGMVCTGLLTGKCTRLPEIQRPGPAPITRETGTR